ncbi:hypothetical protein FOFC_03128 [Fusarium oxysporum]|nr:hypothetical protein FOFC_03128 [Fusarium oxysporum]
MLYSFACFVFAFADLTPSILMLKAVLHVVLALECDRRMFATVT